jgi:hypothetical protein
MNALHVEVPFAPGTSRAYRRQSGSWPETGLGEISFERRCFPNVSTNLREEQKSNYPYPVPDPDLCRTSPNSPTRVGPRRAKVISF